MKYYVVLDTNILVSSLIKNDKNSSINKLLDCVLQNKAIPIYTDDIYDEYKEVLNRVQFMFPSYRIGKILNIIKKYGIKINAEYAKEETIDPDDQIFYDAVITKQDDNAYLVTGNLKHFPIRDFIVSAKRMLNIILSRYVYID